MGWRMVDWLLRVWSIVWPILNTLKDVIAVIGILTVAATVMVIVYQHKNLLCKALNTYRLPLDQAFYLSLRFRKKSAFYTRLFVEYTIFRSKGEPLGREEWKNLIVEFDAKYVKSEAPIAIIEINDTFIFTDVRVKEAIRSYFAFLTQTLGRKKYRKNAQMLGVDISKPIAFLATINVKRGYIVPFTPILSLQDRYQDGWSDILQKYIRTFRTSPGISSIELFTLYNWLMWGPSAKITYQNEGEYKLCEFGLGDELDTIPTVFTDGDAGTTLWKEIDAVQTVGRFIEGEFTLCETKSYFDKNTDYFGISASPFIGFLTHNADKTDFVLELKSYRINQQMESAEYIFTAYVWVMLYYKDHSRFRRRDDTIVPKAENLIPFFEHVNIADSHNTGFLTECLFDKVLSYLRYAAKVFPDRQYAFVWSMTTQLREEFQKRVQERSQNTQDPFLASLPARLTFEETISPDSLLHALDNDFGSSSMSTEFTAIDFSNSRLRGLFARFYGELYLEAFPDENERETLDNMLAQAKRFSQTQNAHYVCIVAERCGQIVGGIVGDFFPASFSAVIEFVVVHSQYRGERIASRLIHNMLHTMEKRTNKHIHYCFAEIENPDALPREPLQEEARLRLGFWKKLGAKRINLDYYQPPLCETKQPLHTLFLSVIRRDEGLPVESISTKSVLAFLNEFFTHGFGIGEAGENEYFVYHKNAVEGRKALELINL
jgi:ribosomal protein S18 acetylase RimI-like enzyme